MSEVYISTFAQRYDLEVKIIGYVFGFYLTYVRKCALLLSRVSF